MARSEARLCVDIWSDDDFLACSAEAQRMFMFLISQPDLAHDGVIALRERRWAGAARGLTPAMVQAALAELQDRRFVVIDEHTEELLIRSFIRRDKVYRQPNVLRAAADHLPLVASHRIRLALAVELARISQESMPEPSTAIMAEMRKALPDPNENPSPNPSGNHAPGTPGERGVVTALGSASPFPGPLAPTPDPHLPLASLAAAPPTITQRSKKITDAYRAAEPMSKWPAVNAIVIRAIKAERWTDEEIQAALLRMAGENRSVTVDSLRIELNGMPPSRASPGDGLVSVGNNRVRPETAARIASRERLAAMDAAETLRVIEGGA